MREKANNGTLNIFVSIYKSGSGCKIKYRLHKSFQQTPNMLKKINRKEKEEWFYLKMNGEILANQSR